MKNNKYAFTLIELLAVIIVLGLIGLIVIPSVIKTIDNSKKETFQKSIDGIISAVNIDKADGGFIYPRCYEYNNRYGLNLYHLGDEYHYKDIDLEGKIIDGDGVVCLDEEGKLQILITGEKWCATNCGYESGTFDGDYDIYPIDECPNSCDFVEGRPQ